MNSFSEIAKKAKFKNKIVNQELGLHCSKCGRDYDYYEFDNGQIIKDGCDCDMIAFAKQSTENFKKKQQRIKANSIFKKSIINDDLADATFDNYLPTSEQLARAKALLERYANNFTLDNKQSILLFGSYGTGKSHLSMATIKRVKEQGYSVLYMNVPQLITTYKDTYNKSSQITEREIDKAISDVDLLVLDDYGTSLSNFGVQKLFEVMESRTGKHNIITTNNSSKELIQNKDLAKIFSRMMKNTTTINMNGEDYRMRGLNF
ncbi:ATP-binding protein [Staphylococcus simulans]|uniref:ATP-binding protein n=1 Tax=Staphylococcus simulans TaxID=1286 RepID=UPI0028A5497A|nr:ATP-binding protein [Staphylococcus simulans]MDT4012011.1 ATP-binding protein [Staphylococcus simulans]